MLKRLDDGGRYQGRKIGEWLGAILPPPSMRPQTQCSLAPPPAHLQLMLPALSPGCVCVCVCAWGGGDGDSLSQGY